MPITHALIIDEPWVRLILSGQKDWEMRSTRASRRGPIGLIRKGSGQIVGIATLTDSLSPLSREEMLASIPRHRIPRESIESGSVDKWRCPWVLTQVAALADPVPYAHPPGAVIWIRLAPEVSQQIASQFKGE